MDGIGVVKGFLSAWPVRTFNVQLDHDLIESVGVVSEK
jgi:hypothetical protein